MHDDVIDIVGNYKNGFHFNFAFCLRDDALVLEIRNRFNMLNQDAAKLERMIFISGLKYEDTKNEMYVILHTMKEFDKFIDILYIVYKFEKIIFRRKLIEGLFEQL